MNLPKMEQKICKTQHNSENEVPRSWQGKVNNNNNNNTDDITCREGANGCHNLKQKDIQIMAKNEVSDNYNDNAEASNLPHASFHKAAPLSPNSNETSANNSTDNLSFLSDNCLVEEVLILQGNLSNESDDEISINSDDCVYAYRGAGYDLSDNNKSGNPVDDETDFLEMDFDPDPASELEHTSDQCLNPDYINKIRGKKENSDYNEISGDSRFNKGDVKNGGKVSEELYDDNGVHQLNNIKSTGAKPKKVNVAERCCNKTPKSSPWCDEEFEIIVNPTESIKNYREAEEACLDCLEKEFLIKTIGKQLEPFECSKCKFKIISEDVVKGPNFNFDLQEITSNGKDPSMHNNYQRNLLCDNKRENLSGIPHSEMTTFPSINVDEKTIVQALEEIDASFDIDVIRRHFNCERNAFADVPELIVHTSKKNCDYKKIIKLLKSASKDRIDVKYTPNEDATIEVVQVNAYDILQSWARNHNLEKLKKLDKRFSQMNVLGKVINLIRQAQQRNAKLSNEFILIPQYYKNGYISVSKE